MLPNKDDHWITAVAEGPPTFQRPSEKFSSFGLLAENYRIFFIKKVNVSQPEKITILSKIF